MTVDGILSDPGSKAFKDFRDRAAYVHITGNLPSHLRTFFTRALSAASKAYNAPVSLDGLSGTMKLNADVITKLDLSDHPMVLKAEEYVTQGWRIKPSRGPNARKPYTKVFMFNGNDQIVVQIDGSILDHL